MASALNDVTRELGTALGVAMLGALLSAGYRRSIDDELDGIPHNTAATAREGLANAVEAAGNAGSHARQVVHAAQQSFIDSWQQSVWAGVAVMGALFVHVLTRGPKAQARAAVATDETETTGTCPRLTTAPKNAYGYGL